MRSALVGRAFATCCLVLVAFGLQSAADGPNGADQMELEMAAASRAQEELLNRLKVGDKCGTIYLSKRHGFEVIEYKTRTKDNYELRLHRIIHPSDVLTAGPLPGAKKPYLLLHGLIGSSASYLRNVADNYRVPEQAFDVYSAIGDTLKHKLQDYERKAVSTADRLRASFNGDKQLEKSPSLFDRITETKREKKFAKVNEIDYDSDRLSFAREFKQAYRKFEMSPEDTKLHVSNSLAFTLSSFGYDVWLINLRGNEYSGEHSGRYTRKRAEYWNFNIDTLIEHDLPASITEVQKVTQWRDEMGLVSYSYSSLHALGLLTKRPEYQEYLQPVIMLAPTLMIGGSAEKMGLRYFMQIVDKLIPFNGPFPNLGRSSDTTIDKIEKIVCRLPIAKKFCALLETILYGRSKSISGVTKLIASDRTESIIRKDVKCGQTSTAVLHQIVRNLTAKSSCLPAFQPFVPRKQLMQRPNKKLRRSVMLIHAERDEISTPTEIERIKDSALQDMTLLDYVIKDPDFGHADFLFSNRNQYLVNAEVARMASVFDFMVGRRIAHEAIPAARGF